MSTDREHLLSNTADSYSRNRFSRPVFWTIIAIAIVLNSVQFFVTANPTSMNDGMEPLFGWPWPIVAQGGIGYHTEYSVSAFLLDSAIALCTATFAGHLSARLMKRFREDRILR